MPIPYESMQLTVDQLKVKTKCFKPKIKHMSAKGFCLEINAMRHIHCLFFQYLCSYHTNV